MPQLDKEDWKHFLEYAIEKSTKEELVELSEDLEFYLGMTYASLRIKSK